MNKLEHLERLVRLTNWPLYFEQKSAVFETIMQANCPTARAEKLEGLLSFLDALEDSLEATFDIRLHNDLNLDNND